MYTPSLRNCWKINNFNEEKLENCRNFTLYNLLYFRTALAINVWRTVGETQTSLWQAVGTAYATPLRRQTVGEIITSPLHLTSLKQYF